MLPTPSGGAPGPVLNAPLPPFRVYRTHGPAGGAFSGSRAIVASGTTCVLFPAAIDSEADPSRSDRIGATGSALQATRERALTARAAEVTRIRRVSGWGSGCVAEPVFRRAGP